MTNPLNQVTIEEKTTIYDIKLHYFSELKNTDFDVEIQGLEESGGKISFFPRGGGSFFEFDNSDPDRVIAIASMMMSFAQMVKNGQKTCIETKTGINEI